MADTPPVGIYRHYKGNLYELVGFGHDADNPDREVAWYVGLMLSEAHEGFRHACRTLSTFAEPICDMDYCPHYGQNWQAIYDQHCLAPEDCTADCVDQCRDDHFVARFTYLGPRFTVEMLRG